MRYRILFFLIFMYNLKQNKMRTQILENYNGQEFEVTIYHASHTHEGRGAYMIEFQIDFMNHSNTFNRRITDTIFIDQITEMKYNDCSSEEIQNAYIDRAFDETMQESIIEWCEEVLEHIEQVKAEFENTFTSTPR